MQENEKRRILVIMEGKIFIEEGTAGFLCIVFVVKQKSDVNGLTLDMIGLGLDALYEPRIVSGRYESCVICSEKIGVKIVAYQQ